MAAIAAAVVLIAISATVVVVVTTDDDEPTERTVPTTTTTDGRAPTAEGSDHITVGDRREGRIRSRFEEATYTFDAEAGDSVTITTEGMDTVLTLLDADDDEVAYDDDSFHDGIGSQLEGALPASGTYRIVVSGYDGETGRFEIRFEEGALDDDLAQSLAQDEHEYDPEAIPLLSGDRLGGTIDDSTGLVVYEVQVQPGASVRIRTAGMDTFLTLYDPDESEVFSDDDGSGTDDGGSLIAAELERAGTYYVDVTASDGETTGTFVIELLIEY